MRYGVCVGYRLKPDCRWSGEYLVFDLDVFLSKDLGVGADVSWGRMAPQSSKTSAVQCRNIMLPVERALRLP